MLKRWFQRIVLKHRSVAFVVMGLAFFVFGAGTLNLFYLLKANTEFLANYGWVAAMEGGLRQLIELLITGYVSLAAYVVFKACEHALVHALVRTQAHAQVHEPIAPDAHAEDVRAAADSGQDDAPVA